MDIVVAKRLLPVLVDQFFGETGRSRLASLGRACFLSTWDDLHSDEARAAMASAEVLVTGWHTPTVDAAVLDAAPKLRAVVHTAGSVRVHVDPECYRRGIAVSSQADLNAEPVAEYAFALILLAGKRAMYAQRVYTANRSAFDRDDLLVGAGNYRSTVGIVGASKIGRRVIALLRATNIDVVVYDPYLDASEAASLGVRKVELAELMRSATVVSLHAPANDETHEMIDATALALLADDATLINTARGALVDQDALIAELMTGRIDAYLDVTEPEVLGVDSPLWALPNVFLTPHIAGAVGNELRRLGDGAIEEIERFRAAGVFTRPVDEGAYLRLA